jgi:hypothetical protein
MTRQLKHQQAESSAGRICIPGFHLGEKSINIACNFIHSARVDWIRVSTLSDTLAKVFHNARLRWPAARPHQGRAIAVAQ